MVLSSTYLTPPTRHYSRDALEKMAALVDELATMVHAFCSSTAVLEVISQQHTTQNTNTTTVKVTTTIIPNESNDQTDNTKTDHTKPTTDVVNETSSRFTDIKSPLKSSPVITYAGSALLGWDERYKILLGVARVLVYLHKDAPNRIIHLGVTPSSIILDKRMNPKLWNFGIARSYTKTEDQFYHTSRITGTYGYIAPEYYFHHHLSAKTDVYSFGVVVLEMLSGHRVYKNIHEINERLLEVVWSNWVEGTYSNIVDPRIKINADLTFMKRVIHIGLLCIQDDAKERPTMEEVLGMLLGTLFIDLPVPKQPWFSRNFDDVEGDIYSSDGISLYGGSNLDDGKADIYPGDDAHYSTDEEFEGR
ncbi:kinase-like domain-containing protein [Tanacetum coccineum]